MNREEIIRSIVATYELPSEREKKVVAAAIINIRKRAINGFQSVYDYIAYLVEIFQGGEIYYKLKKNLDAPISHESDMQLHEVIGAEDPNLVRFTEDEPEAPIPQISVAEVIDILQAAFSDEETALIRELFGRIENAGDLRFNIEAREVIERAQEIKERLLEIAGVYKRGNGIVLPVKEISEINFHPLHIDFRRRYIKDPLAFFNQHRDIYGGMDAQELAEFDRQLFNKLAESSQLGTVLAQESQDYSDSAEEEKTEKISAALKNLGEHWKDADNIVVPPFRECESPLAYFRTHQDKYSGMNRWQLYKNDRSLYNFLLSSRQLDQAIPNKNGGYNHFRGYASPLAYFQAHYEEFKGLKRWRLSQVDPYLFRTLNKDRQMDQAIPESRGWGNKGLDENKIAEIKAAHEKYGGNVRKAASALNLSYSTMYKYWLANGLKPAGKKGRIKKILSNAEQKPKCRRGRKSSLSEDERNVVLAAYEICQGNVMEAARTLQYRPWIVRTCWKSAGLQPKGKRGRKPCKVISPIIVLQELATEIFGRSDSYKRIHKKLTPEDIEDIVAVHLFAQGHVATAVELCDYKYKPHQIRKGWKISGLATERDNPRMF